MLMVYNNVRNHQITRWHQRRIDSNLSDGGHLGDDRQVVDDERNRLLLVLGQILSVAEDAEPCDVGGGVSVVLVHEAGANSIESESWNT